MDEVVVCVFCEFSKQMLARLLARITYRDLLDTESLGVMPYTFD